MKKKTTNKATQIPNYFWVAYYYWLDSSGWPAEEKEEI